VPAARHLGREDDPAVRGRAVGSYLVRRRRFLTHGGACHDHTIGALTLGASDNRHTYPTSDAVLAPRASRVVLHRREWLRSLN